MAPLSDLFADRAAIRKDIPEKHLVGRSLSEREEGVLIGFRMISNRWASVRGHRVDIEQRPLFPSKMG